MIGNGWLQIAIFGAIVVAITKPFGFYMTRVFVGEWTPLSPLLRPVERLVYRCCGVEESEEQSWRLYAISMVLFGATGFVTLYLWQRLPAARFSATFRRNRLVNWGGLPCRAGSQLSYRMIDPVFINIGSFVARKMRFIRTPLLLERSGRQARKGT